LSGKKIAESTEKQNGETTYITPIKKPPVIDGFLILLIAFSN